jgi:putative tryptophan/tyrosine transport system substrate-binding protein
MRRREFIALMGASVTWPFAAMAQQAGRTYRLGGVTSSPRNSLSNGAMLDELRRLDFIEGQNLTIEWRAYALHIDLIPEFAAELVKSKVDVILPPEMREFALYSKRRRPFRSSALPRIWSGRGS